MRFLIRKVFILPGIGLFGIALAALLGSPSPPDDIYTDPRDGKVYDLVEIGDLIWFKENLDFASPTSTCYDSIEANCDKYGRLYSYEEARSVCPEYWRLPNQTDIEALHALAESDNMDRIATPGEWQVNKAKRFSDDLGLAVLPAGRIDSFTYYSKAMDRWVDTVSFHQKGIAASYWLDDRETEDGLLHWHIGTPIGERKSGMHRHHIFPEIHKFSVRCVCGKNDRR